MRRLRRQHGPLVRACLLLLGILAASPAARALPYLWEVDPDPAASFLVLGSASPLLLRQTSESLAGRIAHHALPGLDLAEVGVRELRRRWLRGGFPRSFLKQLALPFRSPGFAG